MKTESLPDIVKPVAFPFLWRTDFTSRRSKQRITPVLDDCDSVLIEKINLRLVRSEYSKSLVRIGEVLRYSCKFTIDRDGILTYLHYDDMGERGLLLKRDDIFTMEVAPKIKRGRALEVVMTGFKYYAQKQ